MSVATKTIAALRDFTQALKRGQKKFPGHTLYPCDGCGEPKRAGEPCRKCGGAGKDE